MNQSEHSITSWLNHLQVLMPPAGITLVGAGNGQGMWAQWLLQQAHAPEITLVEAGARQFAALQRTVAGHGNMLERCRLLNEVAAPQDETISYFVASSAAESGLLQPESLHPLWPNLQTIEIQQRRAVGLEELLHPQRQATRAGGAAPDQTRSGATGQWLLLDCLPAGHMLDKAASKLALVDVLLARVLLDTQESAKALQMLHAGSDFMQRLLKNQNFAPAAIETTRHPAIGYMLFVRDLRATLNQQAQKHKSGQQQAEEKTQQLAQAHAAAERLLAERQTQIGQLAQARAAAEQQAHEQARQAKQLGKARDEQAQLAQERQAQIEQLTQARAAAEQQAQEQAQQAEQLGKARDEQAQLAQERQAQIEQLTQARAAAEQQAHEQARQAEQLGKARDEQAQLAQERQAQIEQLTQAKAAAEQQAHEQARQAEQLGKARDEQTQLAEKRQAQIEQLTQARAAAEQQAHEQARQIEQLGKARDEQAQLAQERQAQIEQLTQARAAAEQQAHEQARQAEQLGKARDEQRAQEFEQVKTATEKLLQEQKAQIDQLHKTMHFELNRNASAESLTRLLTRRFFERTGKLPTENLTTLNEKITWAMMFDVNPLKIQCADKYSVRDYVTKKIGEKYLPKIYGVYDNAESIDFDSLPQSFVICANHGWNQMTIVKHKIELDIPAIHRKLKGWLVFDHFARHCEMQYKFIAPKLITRELLEIDDIEYNIFCFHGKIEYIQAISLGPNHEMLGSKYFSKKWNEQDFYTGAGGKIEKDIPKPHCASEIFKMTETLARDFDFVRVDWLMLKNGNPRFCELTFSPAAGEIKFFPVSVRQSINEKIGNLWKLPECDKDGFSKQGRCILDSSGSLCSPSLMV